MIHTKKCAVIGYGSWATTLVGQLTNNGRAVNWLITNNDVVEGIMQNGRNPKYVNDLELDTSRISISADINEVVSGCSILLLACPSAWLKKNLEPLTVSLNDKFIISAIKGIIPDNSKTVLEYIHDVYDIPFNQLGLISGPTHAEEVSRGRLSFLTAAATTPESYKNIVGLFESRHLIINASTDIYGIEFAAILKNIYAIAVGLATGLGFGENFVAVLISCCANEMKRFINGSYPFERNLDSSAYLGDLIVTCYSNYSRNRRFGLLIGRGCNVKSAMNEMTMVAEGYYSANCIKKVNQKYNINMPISDMVYSVLYEGENARKAMTKLAATLS